MIIGVIIIFLNTFIKFYWEELYALIWYEIFIDIIIGVLSGIIASFVTNHFIEKRINKKVAYREKINELYMFFCNLEIKGSSIPINEVEQFLSDARKVFSTNNVLKRLFDVVDIDLCFFIRTIKNGGQASISFDNENYFNFKNELKKELKESIWEKLYYFV